MAFNDTLFQLGMDLTRSSTAQKEDHSFALRALPHATSPKGPNRPVSELRLEGRNLFIDLHGAGRLADAKSAERALKSGLEKLGKVSANVTVSAAWPTARSRVLPCWSGHLSIRANPKSGFVGDRRAWVASGSTRTRRCSRSPMPSARGKPRSRRRAARTRFPAGCTPVAKSTAEAQPGARRRRKPRIRPAALVTLHSGQTENVATADRPRRFPRVAVFLVLNASQICPPSASEASLAIASRAAPLRAVSGFAAG